MDAGPRGLEPRRMAPTAPRIDDEELPDLLALLEASDSAELKLTVPDADQRAAGEALEIDPLDAHLRLVYFFDTPDLALFEHGVVVRARRSQDRKDDSVVKLRPLTPASPVLQPPRPKGLGVEVDAMPGRYVCSASMKGQPHHGDVALAVRGDRPVHRLFSAAQRELFDANAPAGIALDDLTLLGPLVVLKLKHTPEAFGRRLVAEMWLFPDGSRMLELSTRCAPDDAFRVAAETRAFLAGRGIDLSAEQETKTRRALEFFAARTPT
jgi:hypothetical protein